MESLPSYQQVTPFERWMITITVMLVAVIEVLDMTIVNVSLNNMMGVFGATAEQITWILTGYIVSSAIVMPLSGRLVQLFGRRRLLLINISGFLFSSIICGLSTNLGTMVFFRVTQGIFGASLVPISQYVLRDVFPPESQGKAMAIWGLGIMVAPIMGPTLGGYITDNLNWRWIFYINIPVCVLGFVMTLSFISETPRKKIKMDWPGLILIVLGVGCLQIFLDRGNQEDWFSSNGITALAIIAALSLTVFIVRGVWKKDNIINLHLFKERNFTICTLLLSLFAMCIFGMVALQPMMMEHVFSYPSEVAGMAMAPRGIASAIVMIIIGPVARKLDARLLITMGLITCTYGTFGMTSYSLNDSMWALIAPNIWQGIGIALVMVPVSTVVFDYLNKNDLAEASGLYSFGRSLGMSIGISILNTVVTNETQRSWNTLASYMTTTNPQYIAWVQHQGLLPQDPQTLIQAANLVSSQASMIGFLDAYHLVLITMGLLFLFVPFIKKQKIGGETHAAH